MRGGVGFILALAGAAALVAGPANARQAAPSASTMIPVVVVSPLPRVTAADRVQGRTDAPVTVIEYASFACSHCADWHLFVYPVFKQRLIDTGQVRYVFRDLPTDPAEMSFPAAALMRCAAPDKAFDVASTLMRDQPQAHRTQDYRTWLAGGVTVSGRTAAQVEACANSQQTQTALQTDIAAAEAAGVEGTPTFFVDGRRVEDSSLGGLEIAIRAAQARSRTGSD